MLEQNDEMKLKGEAPSRAASSQKKSFKREKRVIAAPGYDALT